jgi:hypothetical protein
MKRWLTYMVLLATTAGLPGAGCFGRGPGAFLAGAAITGLVAAAIISSTPPPPPREVAPPPPRPGYIWESGCWVRQDGEWVWVSGRWVPAQPGYQWVPSHWAQAGDHWELVEGHWEPVY